MTTKSFILRLFPEKVLVPLKKAYYLYALKRLSELDEPDLTVVKYLVRAKDTVIDVGAHVGWYTKVLSELVGHEGRVYSIEPIPVTFNLLEFCIKRLRFTNVEAINCAISGTDGAATMEIPQNDTGEDSYYLATITNNSTQCLRKHF